MDAEERKKLKFIAWLLGIGAGVVVWAYASFATKEYVDNARAGDRQILEEVHKDVREIRTYLMEKEK